MRSGFILAALTAVAFSFAATGIGWDLPSASRASKILAPGWDRAALFDGLASGWEDIYAKAAGSTPLAAEAAGKYSTRLAGRFSTDFKAPLPEPELWNSYRSMLIRSRYSDEALPLSDLARMRPEKLDFRPPSFLYGGGYLYPLGAYYFVLSKAGALKPMPLRLTLENPDALGRVYLAGRLISAAAFAGICLLVFLIARRLEAGSTTAYAVFAAALTLPVLGIYARFLTPHLWAAFWGLAAIYFSLRALPSLNLKPLLAAGACLGLASGSYWSAAHAAVFIAAILLSPGRVIFRPPARNNLLLALGLSLLVFLALNPYLPASWRLAIAEFSPGGAAAGPVPETGLHVLFLKILPATLGPVLAVIFPAGCLWGLFSGRPALRNLSAAALLLAIPVSATLSPEFPAGLRRFFPWLLTGITIGIVFLGRLTANLRPALKLAVFSLVLAPSLVMSAAYALCFLDAGSPAGTFSRMGGRLDALPARKTLGMTEFPQPAYMPAFRLDRWRLRLADAAALTAIKPEDLPGYLLINFGQKKALSAFLSVSYELDTGFYPRTILGFTPEPLLCGVNPPVELYRLKAAKP